MEEIYSSYAKSNFGLIFKSLILEYPPRLAVELGVLHGYSTLIIALGIKSLHEAEGSFGHLYSYDLFEDYPHRHGNLADVTALLKRNNVSQYVSLKKRDVFGVSELFEDSSVDFLHIDINNDGKIFNLMIEEWNSKLKCGSIMAFEGGSEERDNIEWMKKYKRPSIKMALERNKLANSQYNYGTYSKFPSLTVLLKL